MSVFWDNYSMLCESNNQTPHGVAKKLGISSSAVTAWKRGGMPSGKTILQLCEYFNKTPNNLLMNDEGDDFNEGKSNCNANTNVFWNKFFTLCLTHKRSPNSIGKEIGISSATITTWKNNRMPTGESLKSVAQYFNVSVEYLITDDEIDIKPSKKRTSFVKLDALPQRWESLRAGNTLSTNELLKVASFVQADIAYLCNDSIRYSANSSTVNKYDFETYELILGIFDRCADSILLKSIQIQLSRIVLFWLEKKGFDVDSIVLDKQLSGVSDRKLLFLKSGVADPESAYNFGLNFTELDVLREKTGLSFFYMLTGIEELPIITQQNENTELKKEIAELKTRLAKYEKTS